MLRDIQHTFNAISKSYDAQRQKLIPCFDDFYGMALKLSEQVHPVYKIMDVGAGTGLLSALYAERFPQAKIDLIDISDEMLMKARERFEGNDNIQFILQDFTEMETEKEEYDVVISALAIHHLSDEMKQKLFGKIYYSLRPGGIFINADQVLGASEFSERIYTSAWRTMVENHTELTPEQESSAFERIKLDKMSTLQDQLKWLQDAGFNNTENFYQSYNFVVFAALK